LDDPGHPGKAAVVGTMRGRRMELRNRICQRRHEREIEVPGRCQAVQQRLLRKPVHLDEPFDGRAFSAKRERSSIVAHDRYDSTVQSWRGASVQRHLRDTTRATPLGRREVEIVEPY